MADFEERLRELEESLINTNDILQEKATMPNGENSKAQINCYQYVYIVGALIPLIIVAALYFCKPKWVTKKGKRIDLQRLLMWTAIITVIAWVGLGLVNYCGAFNKMQACF